jgi:Ca-activated chloride channel family protein
VAGGDIRPAVIDVALAHHLVSRFTSLVAVDVTPSRPGAEPLHIRAVPSPLPDGQIGELPSGGTASRLELALGLTLLLPALLAGLFALGGLRRRTPAVALRRAG